MSHTRLGQAARRQSLRGTPSGARAAAAAHAPAKCQSAARAAAPSPACSLRDEPRAGGGRYALSTPPHQPWRLDDASVVYTSRPTSWQAAVG